MKSKTKILNMSAMLKFSYQLFLFLPHLSFVCSKLDLGAFAQMLALRFDQLLSNLVAVKMTIVVLTLALLAITTDRYS